VASAAWDGGDKIRAAKSRLEAVEDGGALTTSSSMLIDTVGTPSGNPPFLDDPLKRREVR
jgi:hypothetical protein